MVKNELINILNNILIPIGFKKKGSYWIINGDGIIKMVNLQKSQFGNSFYINYGYILKSISLDGLMMHVNNRLTSNNKITQQRITELLDLESNVSDDDRTEELNQIIINELVYNVQLIDTEEDLLNELKGRPHLNNIPIVVKKHFALA